ncbi:RNA polymerase sigma factor [Clostridia bacterium]|nr:RNA polymerase sigma factor [Clostridia bacterium]
MTSEQQEHIRHRFDAYCKRAVKRTAINLQHQIKRLGEREIAFTALPAPEMAKLSVTDKYFADEYVFELLGASVGVNDYELGAALSALPADRREIVLMSYFFDMTDAEIAARLNMARSTVAYQRTSSLQLLKNLLESEE